MVPFFFKGLPVSSYQVKFLPCLVFGAFFSSEKREREENKNADSTSTRLPGCRQFPSSLELKLTSFVLRSSAGCITAFCWGALNNPCPTLFLVFRTIDYYRQKKNSGQYSKNRPSHFKINYFSLGSWVSYRDKKKNSQGSKIRTLMAFWGSKFGLILFYSSFRFH